MAAGVAGAPCVLVIDEINRADLSRVFGELLMLSDSQESIGRRLVRRAKNLCDNNR
jgi:hypothetical protein